MLDEACAISSHLRLVRCDVMLPSLVRPYLEVECPGGVNCYDDMLSIWLTNT